MRYAKTKKRETRESILRCAHALFAAKGFDAVSIDDVMRACALTRGGFYAHFRSKGELYRESMQQALLRGHMALSTSDNPSRATLDRKLLTLIDECISAKPSNVELHKRFAFLATDLASDSKDVRTSYALAIVTLLNQLTVSESGQFKPDSKSLPAALAMIVGTAAIVRSVDDPALREQFVNACKRISERLSTSLEESSGPALLWEGLYGLGFKEQSQARN